MIRLQNAGGLGNQLFIWAAAHKLAHEFGEKVLIVDVKDRNSRIDRNSELRSLKIHCDHEIFVVESLILGYMFRMIDKLKLEKYARSHNLLQRFGFYSSNQATDEFNFDKAMPKIVRSFFQRNDYVDSSWEFINGEIKLRLQETKIPATLDQRFSQVIHFRRGDFIDIRGSHGLLAFDYFAKNTNPDLKYVFCTDDPNAVEEIQFRYPFASVMTPAELDVWQTLKVFVEAGEFLGSNSTLSWWGAKIRSKNSLCNTSLPRPWTKSKEVDATALDIPGVDYKEAKFED